MKCISFLVALRKASITVEVKEGKLAIKAAPGALSEEFKRELVAKKAEIMLAYQTYRVFSNTQFAQVSFAQQRLWFLNQLDVGSSHNNMPQQLRFQGKLNIDALESALNAIIERHQILRTTYINAGGEPFQVINQHLNRPLEVIDLSHLPPELVDQQARILIDEEVTKPFDLTKDLMLRTKLLRLTDTDCLLLYTMHHIASDGWSQGILINEFNVLYNSFDSGEAANLPQLTIQYADYAHWQRNWLQGEVLDNMLGYWVDKLQGIPSVHNLPLDRPRPNQQTYNGSQYHCVIPPETLGAFKNLLRKQNCTLFMGMHSLLALLIGRLSGDDDIVIGTPIANREQQGIASLIGFFINVLVLRSELNKVDSFEQLLKQSKQVALGAYAHQQVPFEELIKVLNLSKSQSVSQVFQIMLVLQNNDVGKLGSTRLKFQQRESKVSQSKFDLSVNAVEMDGSLYIAWDYNTDLFEHTSIARMAECFEYLFTAAVAQPNVPLAKLPLLKVAHSNHSQGVDNDKQTSAPATCIHHLVEKWAELEPETDALIFGPLCLSYRELNRQANQLAHLLIANGVECDQPLAIYLPRGEKMIVAVLAILKAGGCYVAIEHSYPLSRVESMCDEVGVRLLLTDHFSQDSCHCKRLKVVELSDEVTQQRIGYCPHHNPTNRALSRNLAYMCFTSGSTGKPKAVMVTHQNLYAYYQGVKEAYQLTAHDNILQFSSVSFDIFVEETFCSLCSGATLVVRSDEMLSGGAVFWQFLQTHHITVMSLPTAYWHSLCSSLQPEQKRALDPLRLLILGGESMSASMLRLWQQGTSGPTKVLNTYGPTETTVIACYYDATHLDTQRGSVPIGKPLKNVRCYVLDANLQLCPNGVYGQLHIAGETVSRGYYGRVDLTYKHYVSLPHLGEEKPVYRSGDLVRVANNGDLEFKGRIDGQVKIRGFRVEVEEIEYQLNQSALVTSCMVIAKTNNADHNYLAAYVQFSNERYSIEGEALLLDKLADELKQVLPDYMLPSAWAVVSQWPLTSQGKVDKKRLPEANLAWRQGEYVELTSETERELVQIWSQLLGIDEGDIGATANFFELGGHSLLCVKLVSEISTQMNVELGVKTIFEGATVQQMAESIDRRSDPEFKHFTKSSQEQEVLQHFSPLEVSLPTVFFVPGVAGSAFMFSEFAIHAANRFNVQAFNHQGIFDQQQPFTSIQANADDFYMQILSRQKSGRYYIAGHSYGGVIAYEIAKRLNAQGQDVCLILLDTYFDQPSLVKRMASQTDFAEVGETHQHDVELDSVQQAFQDKITDLARHQTQLFYDYQFTDSGSLQPIVVLAEESPFDLADYKKKLQKNFFSGVTVNIVESNHFAMLKGQACREICSIITAQVGKTSRSVHSNSSKLQPV